MCKCGATYVPYLYNFLSDVNFAVFADNLSSTKIVVLEN